MVAQVEEQIRTLEERYKNRLEEVEENEGAGATMKDMLDAKWQSMLQKFFTMQDLGNNFINSSNMVRNFVEQTYNWYSLQIYGSVFGFKTHLFDCRSVATLI